MGISRSDVGKTSLIEGLIDRAMQDSFLCSQNRGNGEKYRSLLESDKPGRMIMALSDKERDALKGCTSKDFSWRGFK